MTRSNTCSARSSQRTILRLAVASVLGAGVLGLAGCGGKGASTPEAGGSATVSDDSTAAKMIALGREHTDKLLNHSQTAALRNMLGGARAVFIAPDIGGGSFVVGVDSGTGALMLRHGEEWSDPVFYTLTETSAGEQLGIKDAHVIVLLMTDTAVQNFVNGRVVVGGRGGLTLGTVGFGVTGAGGVNGGLELLIVSTSQGLSLGGGLSTIEPKIATDLNKQAYGSQADPKRILASAGGNYAPARGLRQDLSRMVHEAWDVSATGQK